MRGLFLAGLEPLACGLGFIRLSARMDREDRDAGDGGQRDSGATHEPPPLPSLRRAAGRDQVDDIGTLSELARRLRSAPRLGCGELDRIEQATGTAPELLPPSCCILEPATTLLVGATGLDPACQRRPCGGHDLMSEIDTRIV